MDRTHLNRVNWLLFIIAAYYFDYFSFEVRNSRQLIILRFRIPYAICRMAAYHMQIIYYSNAMLIKQPNRLIDSTINWLSSCDAPISSGYRWVAFEFQVPSSWIGVTWWCLWNRSISLSICNQIHSTKSWKAFGWHRSEEKIHSSRP